MVSGVIVDLDGTVYHGDDPLEGVREGIDALRSAGTSVLFFSNNPIYTGADYVERLRGMGLDVRPGEAVSAGDVTTEYLTARHADDRVFLIGSERLRRHLADSGVDLTDDPEAAEVLLASWTPEFHYDDMVDALRAHAAGATLLGTDPDRTFPNGQGRPVPGSGAVVNAVAGVLETEPEHVLGKPSREATDAALARLDLPPEECLVVGDRLSTDVAMGERAGMETALVLTGVTDRSDLDASSVRPDHVLRSLGELPEVLE